MNKPFLIFDWGDTIMRDLNLLGKMKDWPVVEWVPGAKEMLDIIGNSFVACIATSAAHSDTNDMIAALKRVDADKYFKYFFSSNDLGAEKPDPAFFTSIVKRVGLQEQNCISIGNLYNKDIVPAKVAGLGTIWFNELKINSDFPMADAIIHDWKQLPDALKEYVR